MIDLFAIIDRSPRLSDETKRSYKNNVRRWLAFAGADPARWDGDMAQRFYQHLLDEKCTIRSSNTVLWGIRYAIERARQLHRELGAFPNPIDAVERAKPRRQVEPTPLSPEDARALLAACAGTDLLAMRDWSMVLVGLYTGMRRSSLLAVDLDHVKFFPSHVRLRVPLKGSGGELYPVPLHEDVWGTLEVYRSALGKVHGPLFPAIDQRSIKTNQRSIGGQLSEGGVNYLMNRRAKAAGLRGFHPHLLRHTFVEWCDQDSIEDLLKRLVTGHAGGGGLGAYQHRESPELGARAAIAVRAAIHKRIGV